MYEDWKLEGAWPELPKVKQGLMLTLAIANYHPMGLKHKFLGPSVGMSDLKAEQGVENFWPILTEYFFNISLWICKIPTRSLKISRGGTPIL